MTAQEVSKLISGCFIQLKCNVIVTGMGVIAKGENQQFIFTTSKENLGEWDCFYTRWDHKGTLTDSQSFNGLPPERLIAAINVFL